MRDEPVGGSPPRCKLKIASSLRGQRDSVIRQRLTRDAVELLRRTIHLPDDPTATAWCCFDLARALGWLRARDT